VRIQQVILELNWDLLKNEREAIPRGKSVAEWCIFYSLVVASLRKTKHKYMKLDQQHKL
jgi:hypothetical protein